MKRARERIFRWLVEQRRAGGGNEWYASSSVDRGLAKRLVPRLKYGGRKGWRAFLRLWRMGMRPVVGRERRVKIVIKGFELGDGTRHLIPEETSP